MGWLRLRQKPALAVVATLLLLVSAWRVAERDDIQSVPPGAPVVPSASDSSSQQLRDTAEDLRLAREAWHLAKEASAAVQASARGAPGSPVATQLSSDQRQVELKIDLSSTTYKLALLRASQQAEHFLTDSFNSITA